MQKGNVAVAHMPALPACQGIAHNVGTNGSANAPHAVKPAHVAARVVKRHIIIERSIHAPSPQPVGDCPEAEQRERAGDGKAKKCEGGHGDADRRNHTGSETARQPVALEAGYDCTGGDNHCNDSGIGKGHMKFHIHRRPGRAKQRVRQTETDKG